MLILTKSALVIIIGFILSTILGTIIVPILKKNNAEQRLSVYLQETHKSKSNTPTMGGLIFIIPVIIIMALLFVLKKIEINYNIIIVLFTFLSYSFIGFLDDYLIIKRNNNKGLSVSQKFIMQVIIIQVVIIPSINNNVLIVLFIDSFKIPIKLLVFLFIFKLLFKLINLSFLLNNPKIILDI